MATVLRTTSVLTGAYVTYNCLNTGENNQLNFYLTYTKGDEDSLDVKVEVSSDQASWYQLPMEEPSAGVITVTPALWRFNTPVSTVIQIPCTFNHARISVKGRNGTPTGTLGLAYEEDNV